MPKVLPQQDFGTLKSKGLEETVKTDVHRKAEAVTSAEDAKDVWEKRFVDWFSKQILPTRPFKLFMQNVCTNLTSTNLAAIPFDFLSHFESGDRYALNCLPNNHIEAQTLYSFVNQYRKMKPEFNLGESYRTVKKDASVSLTLKTSHGHRQSAQDSDVTIPVLISGPPQSKQKNPKQNDLKLIESISKTQKIPVKHAVKLRSIFTPASHTTDTRKIITHTSTTTMQSLQSPLLFAPVVTIATRYDKNQSGSANFSSASERVNPRWNAEVQQFIGRTKSASSRPIYLEYLEKKGEVILSNDAIKKVFVILMFYPCNSVT